MKMYHFFLVLLLSLVGLMSISLVSCGSTPSSSALQDKCSPVIAKLGECLAFATAKADTPTATCCNTVEDIRQQNPVCLCFIIQMTHDGGSDVTSLGLQVDRLIQLPSACKLTDTKVSNCPKLLNLSPSSPDYAIFTNATKASSTTVTPSTSKPTSEGALMDRIHFLGTIAIAAAMIFLSIF